MVKSITINKTTFKSGAGLQTTNYAQLLYNGEEIGFINDEGVF